MLDTHIMSKKETKILSFVGGLIFFSVVAGILISNDDKIRAEIQEQAKGLLKTSKKALQQLQYVVSKVGKLTGDLKSEKETSNLNSPQTEPITDSYDTLWVQAEAQNAGASENN
jgi:hypothetical protein